MDPAPYGRMMPGWIAIDRPDSVHVLPIGDTLEHEYSADCPCGPEVEEHAVPLITHASLDGRELVYG